MQNIPLPSKQKIGKLNKLQCYMIFFRQLHQSCATGCCAFLFKQAVIIPAAQIQLFRFHEHTFAQTKTVHSHIRNSVNTDPDPTVTEKVKHFVKQFGCLTKNIPSCQKLKFLSGSASCHRLKQGTWPTQTSPLG